MCARCLKTLQRETLQREEYFASLWELMTTFRMERGERRGEEGSKAHEERQTSRSGKYGHCYFRIHVERCLWRTHTRTPHTLVFNLILNTVCTTERIPQHIHAFRANGGVIHTHSWLPVRNSSARSLLHYDKSKSEIGLLFQHTFAFFC
jgi:hypothetical protein